MSGPGKREGVFPGRAVGGANLAISNLIGFGEELKVKQERLFKMVIRLQFLSVPVIISISILNLT